MGTHHYSLGQNTMKLSGWAADTAKKLHDKMELNFKDYTLILCYEGMSGISQATALSLAYYKLTKKEIYMAYARKTGEKSHGNRVEYNIDNYRNKEKFLLVFVDDFVSSGATLTHTFTQIIKELETSDKNYKININKEKYIRCMSESFDEFDMPDKFASKKEEENPPVTAPLPKKVKALLEKKKQEPTYEVIIQNETPTTIIQAEPEPITISTTQTKYRVPVINTSTFLLQSATKTAINSSLT